jgi:eukaryotic-like serine/threonine-protein kinase
MIVSDTERLKQDWDWVGRFVAVIVVALILSAVIGSMDLFTKTFVIEGKLSAAHLVRFLGYSTALGALWMLGQRGTITLQQRGGRWSFMQHLILPVVTLIVVSSANSIALLVLKPMMNASTNNIYNWVFIVAILACAVWVVMAVMGQSSSLTEAFTSVAGRIGATEKTKKCAACGAGNEPLAKFCMQCGKELAE